jgi:hypothetical protein
MQKIIKNQEYQSKLIGIFWEFYYAKINMAAGVKNIKQRRNSKTVQPVRKLQTKQAQAQS